MALCLSHTVPVLCVERRRRMGSLRRQPKSIFMAKACLVSLIAARRRRERLMFLRITLLVYAQSGGYGGPPRILRRPYYRNGCTDSNQILHSGRDHRVRAVGCPNTRSANPRWRTDAVLENLNTLISPRRVGRSRRNFAGWCVVQMRSRDRTVGHILKFRKFKMAAAAILETRKISLLVCGSVCLSSGLWKNGGSDPDAAW